VSASLPRRLRTTYSSHSLRSHLLRRRPRRTRVADRPPKCKIGRAIGNYRTLISSNASPNGITTYPTLLANARANRFPIRVENLDPEPVELLPPDVHYLNAAIGWLGLGRRDYALVELQNISAENQRHPDVLEARWAIFAQDNDWDDALAAARKLVRLAPDRVTGWLHQAYALRRATGRIGKSVGGFASGGGEISQGAHRGFQSRLLCLPDGAT
jgi:hypothetical protein